MSKIKNIVIRAGITYLEENKMTLDTVDEQRPEGGSGINYQEALDELECYSIQWAVNYMDNETAAKMLSNSQLLQQLIDIYPEYLDLKAKAKPKKPIRIGTYKEDVLCPICKSDYTWLSKTVGWEREMVMFPHCAKCSQAIDWSK
jgi:hypothetical protein